MIVLVAAIAHEDTFAIDDLVGSGVGIVVVVAGIVGDLLFPADWEVARWILFAEEQTRSRGATLLTRVPRLEDALNLVLPVRDINASAGGDHDNCLLPKRGDLVDE